LLYERSFQLSSALLCHIWLQDKTSWRFVPVINLPARGRVFRVFRRTSLNPTFRTDLRGASGTARHCCQSAVRRSRPVTHPAEYLEWATQSDNTLTCLCAGFHMYAHTHTHTHTLANQHPRQKLALRCTLTLTPPLFLLLLSPPPPFPSSSWVGCTFFGVTCLPLSPLMKVGIPISRRPTAPPRCHGGGGGGGESYNGNLTSFVVVVVVVVERQLGSIFFTSPPRFSPFFSPEAPPTTAPRKNAPRFDSLHLACQRPSSTPVRAALQVHERGHWTFILPDKTRVDIWISGPPPKDSFLADPA